jgi:hypothetical protein
MRKTSFLLFLTAAMGIALACSEALRMRDPLHRIPRVSAQQNCQQSPSAGAILSVAG